MNEDDFIEALGFTDRNWHLNSWGQIRMKGEFFACACPITSLDPSGMRTAGFYVEAARALGISDDLRERIANAADNLRGCDRTLRGRMLEACSAS